MRLVAFSLALALTPALSAFDTPKTPASEPKSVTVPITLDHNRIIIEVGLPLPDGSTQSVHAWVNGIPSLYFSKRAADLMGLSSSCDAKTCTAPPPRELRIGGMRIPLAQIKSATVALRFSDVSPGTDAEINLPATVLRNYDILIDLPNRELTIAQPGTLKFKGVSAKARISADTGLIDIPSQIENKKCDLLLALWPSMSFLFPELFASLADEHADWPEMTGAVGPANLWGTPGEVNWKLMRADRVHFGPLFLTNVAFAQEPMENTSFLEKRIDLPVTGLLGTEALTNYRIGLDYAHSTVYFDIGRLANLPDFDVVGLILRAENDGRFSILGVADYEGKPSVPVGADGIQAGDHLVAVDGNPVANFTMGQVWALLQGSPGQERTLTLERGAKEFTVVVHVEHFLGEEPGRDESKRKADK